MVVSIILIVDLVMATAVSAVAVARNAETNTKQVLLVILFSFLPLKNFSIFAKWKHTNEKT